MPDTRPGCCGPDVRALTRAPPLARAPTHWCVDPGGETGGNVFILASPFSGCSDLWASLLGGSELWVYGILANCSQGTDAVNSYPILSSKRYTLPMNKMLPFPMYKISLFPCLHKKELPHPIVSISPFL